MDALQASFSLPKVRWTHHLLHLLRDVFAFGCFHSHGLVVVGIHQSVADLPAAEVVREAEPVQADSRPIGSLLRMMVAVQLVVVAAARILYSLAKRMVDIPHCLSEDRHERRDKAYNSLRWPWEFRQGLEDREDSKHRQKQ